MEYMTLNEEQEPNIMNIDSKLPYFYACILYIVRETAKKLFFYSGPATNRGIGKGLSIKKNPPKNVSTKEVRVSKTCLEK